MARNRRQQADPRGGRVANAPRPAPYSQGRANSIMFLVSKGMPLERAQRFARDFQFNSLDQTRQWYQTWGRTDWSQNTGPDGTPVPAPSGDPGGTNTPEVDPDTTARRESVYDAVMGFFQNLGLPGAEMSAFVRSQSEQDYEDWQIIDNLRQQDFYNRVFTGLNDLRAQQPQEGWDEAKWIQQRAAYRDALRFMPEGFYDEPQDFTNFMVNRVSPLEVERRALFAKQQLDEADPEMKRALRQFYGISDGALTAYLLDPEKAQPLIDREMRAASYQRYVLEAGQNLTQQQAEALAASAGGAAVDALTADGQGTIASQVGNAAMRDRMDATLTQIEGDNSYTFMDSLAAETGDVDKRLKSEARAEREKARFSGTSGLGRGSLSKRRGD